MVSIYCKQFLSFSIILFSSTWPPFLLNFFIFPSLFPNVLPSKSLCLVIVLPRYITFFLTLNLEQAHLRNPIHFYCSFWGSRTHAYLVCMTACIVNKQFKIVGDDTIELLVIFFPICCKTGLWEVIVRKFATTLISWSRIPNHSLVVFLFWIIRLFQWICVEIGALSNAGKVTFPCIKSSVLNKPY